MRSSLPAQSILTPMISAVLVALGIAVNNGFDTPLRTIPVLLLTVVGLLGAASSVADLPLEALGLAVKQWWVLAFALFVPYALAIAPSNQRAGAVGDAFSDPLTIDALEAGTGAVFLCAFTISVLYWFASYGVHPGRRTPEERILNDNGD